MELRGSQAPSPPPGRRGGTLAEISVSDPGRGWADSGIRALVVPSLQTQ